LEKAKERREVKWGEREEKEQSRLSWR
jgi:hypothetical protein